LSERGRTASLRSHAGCIVCRAVHPLGPWHAACSIVAMRKTPAMRISIRAIGLAAVFCLAPLVRAQASEIITATAHLKTAGGVGASAPVRIEIERFSTDAERDEVMAALKRGGTEAVQTLLSSRAQIGSVQVGGSNTAVQYAYARPAGANRLITVVTGAPIAFVGAGLPGAAPKTGYNLGLVLLELGGSKSGTGELAPAAKVRLNDTGPI